MNHALAIAAERMGGATLPDNAAYMNRVQIRSSSSSRLYVVAQRKTDGTLTCSCMGWIRHRNCKHVAAFRPVLAEALKRKEMR